jgi:hypothetical protein
MKTYTYEDLRSYPFSDRPFPQEPALLVIEGHSFRNDEPGSYRIDFDPDQTPTDFGDRYFRVSDSRGRFVTVFREDVIVSAVVHRLDLIHDAYLRGLKDGAQSAQSEAA